MVRKATEICGLDPEGHWKVLVMAVEIFDVGLKELLSKSLECFLCLGCKMFKSERGSFRKGKSSSPSAPQLFSVS